MAHHALSSETPVVIACEDVEMAHYQVMLNLHAESPPSFSRFERLSNSSAPATTIVSSRETVFVSIGTAATNQPLRFSKASA